MAQSWAREGAAAAVCRRIVAEIPTMAGAGPRNTRSVPEDSSIWGMAMDRDRQQPWSAVFAEQTKTSATTPMASLGHHDYENNYLDHL